ncbi:hypothetical protein BGY98DRAFT_683825 [Russula aff. rugulosa BPL654]|nr:hypothetical protein BGY98DRAFT_683825 [Russula aff. rugulosa BPL654]
MVSPLYNFRVSDFPLDAVFHNFQIIRSILGRPVDRHLLVPRMKRFRQACKLLIKHVLRFTFCLSWLIRDLARTLRESGSNKDVGVSHEALVGGAPWYDEWGVLPHHFETVSPPREKATKGGNSLKQMRSMPFPSRRAPDELAPPVPSPRPPPTSRHTRKNSKVAQFLGLAGTPERARDAENAVDPQGFMSPPLLPMEADPFSCPLGTTIVSNVTPTTQGHLTHPPAPQHTFRPMQSMPSLSSLSVPPERHAVHAHVSHAHTPQSISDFQVAVDTTARRAPRPLQRAGYYAHIGSHSSRSLSNPPPAPSVPNHYSSLSQPLQPTRVVNLESRSRHGSTSAHITHRGRHQNMRDHAPMAAPNLRKARSSVVLSNTRVLPLHAPKPVKVLERPSVETLHKLAESASGAMPSHSKARNREVAVHAVWPPAPVLRPCGTSMRNETRTELRQLRRRKRVAG